MGQRKAKAIPIDRSADTEDLEALLSQPTEAAVVALAKLDGDLIVLGVPGKMTQLEKVTV